MVAPRLRRLLEPSPDQTSLKDRIRQIAQPLRDPNDLDSLLGRIGPARYVLLGEASHGTSEFYTWRTAISRRLIREKGFSFIAVEGDWPDCYRVNRFIRGLADSGESAREVLHNFERWPTWMWANHEVLDLIRWLHPHNTSVPENQRVGFYGLDVYSLWDSLYRVLAYLGRTRPEALEAGRRVFQCFEPFGEDVHDYAQATRWLDESCEDEVVSLLAELRQERQHFAGDGSEGQFDAEQNALVVKNAEHYYRTMVRADAESWNIRDRHMTETLERLMKHHGSHAKGIVWEHNTHIGDARYTDMANDGTVNVGQLVRETHDSDDVVLVGFGSHRGSVIAGRGWDAPMQRMRVPPGRAGSWENVLQSAGESNKLLIFDEQDRNSPLAEIRGHRAIGVVYHSEYERGNYVPTVLSQRYDAFLFLEQTAALHPLQEVHARDESEVPETYPSGV
jgi:erythromycin esterase